MSSTVLTILFAAAAMLFALALAFLPLRILVFTMAKNVRGTVRDWVQRARRDRRTAPRETPDRRTEPPVPSAEQREADRRDRDRRSLERRDPPAPANPPSTP